MKWLRDRRGLYDSDDGIAHLTFIPGHWEVTIDGNAEDGRGADAWDANTLAEAKRQAEAHLSAEA